MSGKLSIKSLVGVPGLAKPPDVGVVIKPFFLDILFVKESLYIIHTYIYF